MKTISYLSNRRLEHDEHVDARNDGDTHNLLHPVLPVISSFQKVTDCCGVEVPNADNTQFEMCVEGQCNSKIYFHKKHRSHFIKSRLIIFIKKNRKIFSSILERVRE